MQLAQSLIVLARLLWYFSKVHYLATVKLLVQMFEKHKKPELTRKDGHVAIVTGGSRGIGLEVVKQLLSVGYHVIIGCRSKSGEEDLLKDLQETYPESKVEIIPLDLTSMTSVRKFASKFLEKNLQLHVLINNAGVMFGPYQVTEDGFEHQLSVNYLGHVLLTRLLLPKLASTGQESTTYSRIINVSSCVQYVGNIQFGDLNSRLFYSQYAGYAQSKLAQIMFTRSLQEKMVAEGLPITCNALHPGVILTDLYQNVWYVQLAPWLFKILFKSARDGADGIMFLATSEKLEREGGKYFENCSEMVPNSAALDARDPSMLWEHTCRMLQISEDIKECDK